MSQSLSDDEFHRMQLQIIEMRTENYQLKDDNKKQSMKLKELTEREIKLDKELNKQMKMKKALSMLNKSKQAQEYEALLQQTEQEFSLQNQTLMAELSRLSEANDKFEKENRRLKNNESADVTNDSELRRLQAQNTALKNNIESIHLKHKEELQLQLDSFRQSTPSSDHSTNEGEWVDPLSLNNVTDDANTSMVSNNSEQMNSDGIMHESYDKYEHSIASHSSDVATDERLLHVEAQSERLKQKLTQLQDVQVQYETEKEEKNLLQKALEEERSHHSREHRALTNEVNAFRDKLDRKQEMFLQLHDEKEKLFQELQAKSRELLVFRESAAQELHEDKEKLKNEIASLGNALQNSHNVMERQQVTVDNLQKQLKKFENEKNEIIGERDEMKERLLHAAQTIQSHEHRQADHATGLRSLEERNSAMGAQLEKSVMERDDAITKFEENARASGALLQRVDQVEHANEDLQRQLAEAKELAEKRKKVMDKLAVESQENNSKLTEKLTTLQCEYEATSKRNVDNYEEKIKALEHSCKRQEQELIRLNHQDRAKTREVDSCQQQVRDMQAIVTSLENSKGWFERAFEDAEKQAEEKQEEHLKIIEEIKCENHKEIEKIKLEISKKDKAISEVEEKVEEERRETVKRDEVIERLKQDIQDEVSKQRLVEKKGHSALKDLKRQLINERKRNEKLQEKLGEISSSNSNLDELLQVVDVKETTGEDHSSVSSFSFRDLITLNKPTNSDINSQASSSTASPNPVANVSKAESRDLLARVTSLQQDKWNLEEQVRHLEESAGAMADELLEKSKLLQEYVQRTRTDVHKSRTSNEELGSRKFSDRMKSIITGQEEVDFTNIRELNRKLTRMLEEEMTKNMSLKHDLATLSNQLAEK